MSIAPIYTFSYHHYLALRFSTTCVFALLLIVVVYGCLRFSTPLVIFADVIISPSLTSDKKSDPSTTYPKLVVDTRKHSMRQHCHNRFSPRHIPTLVMMLYTVIARDVAERVHKRTSERKNDDSPWIVSIQQILSCRCQVRIKEQPKELRTSCIGVILFSRPSHGTIGREWKYRGFTTTSQVFNRGFVLWNTLVRLEGEFEWNQAFTMFARAQGLSRSSHKAVGFAFRVTRLDYESIGTLNLHIVVKATLDQIDKATTRDGGYN